MTRKEMIDKLSKAIKDKSLVKKYLMAKYFSYLERRREGKKFLENNLQTSVKTLIKMMQCVIWAKNKYFGIPTGKSPEDFWVYMEIIYELQPDIIIEIGNFMGGSTLALAHILDNIGKGRIIGLDINHNDVPLTVKKHPRIRLITGDACELFPTVRDLITTGEKVLIIEDSSHTYKNTINVLRTYNSLVSKGSYFIVEDTIVNHGLDFPGEFLSGGPYEAVETFMKENDNFIIDRSREKFIITWNPRGYLKKIK